MPGTLPELDRVDPEDCQDRPHNQADDGKADRGLRARFGAGAAALLGRFVGHLGRFVGHGDRVNGYQSRWEGLARKRAHLPTVPEGVIAKNKRDHRFGHGDPANRDARIVAALGHDIGIDAC